MANWTNEAQAREQIKELVAQYYHDFKEKKEPSALYREESLRVSQDRVKVNLAMREADPSKAFGYFNYIKDPSLFENYLKSETLIAEHKEQMLIDQQKKDRSLSEMLETSLKEEVPVVSEASSEPPTKSSIEKNIW